ncbi:MAG TPA: hypothetical protein VFP24_01880 [Gaiellaceae bacterium]|jgi:hypothetical protein|nr:hypothetical protein [Gaiellaceae bacterium]
MSRVALRVTGILFVVLILVSELLKGDSPSPTGPTEEITSFFDERRSSILAGAYVQMLALFLLALLFASLAPRLMSQELTSGRLARIGLVLVLAAYTGYAFWTAATAFGAALDAGPETAKALWEIRFVAETFVNLPVALFVGAVGIAATVGRGWYRWASLAVAAAFLVGGAALARNGFFAPDGGYGFILFWLLPLWVVVTAFVATPRPAS